MSSEEEEARVLCFGPPGAQEKDVDFFVNRRGQKLFSRYWKPGNDVPPRALAFISHGFSEHLGLYHSVGNALAAEGVLVFGHDYVGHGRSEGKVAYIDSVDDYVDDVFDHCTKIRSDYGKTLPLFLIGHSMGGMVTLTMAIRYPALIKGMVLVGPLVIAGRSIGPLDFRLTSFRAFPVRCILSCFDMIAPELIIGYVNYNFISRDEQAKKCMQADPLKWHGGCKIHLLLAFVKCLEDNFNQLAGINVPFIVFHGEHDRLCNIVGSRILSEVAYTDDKKLVEFPNGAHQLYLEIPEVRTKVLTETVEWICKRCA